MTGTRPEQDLCPDWWPPTPSAADIARKPAPCRESVEARRELLEQLQVMDVHLQTAAELEARADRSVNAAFAAVLRERAGDHRQTAARVRADLRLRWPLA